MKDTIKVELTNKGWSGWWITLAFCLGLFLSPNKAEAKNITIGLIEYGVTASNVCNTLQDGDVLKLRTQGGSVDEAHKLVECIRNKDVIVQVIEANSAGIFVVFGAKKVCLTKRTEVATHSPYAVWPDGSIMTLTMDQVRASLAHWGKQLIKQGYPPEDVFFLLGITIMTPAEDMTPIRKPTLKRLLGDRYIGECRDVL